MSFRVTPSAARNLLTPTPIAAIREGTAFTRSITAVILTTFLALILRPTAAAAREVAADSAKVLGKAAAPSDDQSLAVIALTRTLKDLESAAAARQNVKAQKVALKALQEKLLTLDQQTVAEFQATEATLKKLNLGKALTRHYDAAARFEKESGSVHAQLRALLALPESSALTPAARALRSRLESYDTGRTHEPFDPTNLPFRMPTSKIRAPKLTTKELQGVLNPNLRAPRAAQGSLPVESRKVEVGAAVADETTTLERYQALARTAESVEVASIGSMAGLLAVSAITPPGPEYLAPTEDVQITQTIRDLASQLHNNPVEIFNWVRNNIEFLPTYGSIQGSDLTLLSKRGNAYDSASLLIALLRAANIPARYVYGTVQIPAAAAMNWLDAMETADAAAELMSQGGIPNLMVTGGGKVTAFRLEHIWVEAFVDFYPSRGAKNITPDTWVPMDPSFKQYTHTAGMNLPRNVPFDGQALLSEVEANAEVSESEGWVRGIDEPIVQNALSSYQTRLQDYVDSQKPDATVGDVLGNKSVIASSAPVLASSLPYKLIATASPYAVLPATLRHTVKFEFFGSATDRTYDNPEFTVERGLPSLAGKRMSLIYEPASEEEKQALANAFENFETTFAAYAIDFKPTLKLETGTLASAAATMTGTPQFLRVTTRAPWYERPQEYPLKSGDTMVLAVNAAGVTPGVFEARTQAHDLSDGDDPDFTVEMFYQVALGFWGEEEAFAQIIGDLGKVISHRMPSHGMAGAPVTVTYRYGVPNRATYNTRILDVKENLITAEHKADDSSARIAFAKRRGYLGSYLEAGIYDQTFLMTPGFSVSAVTGLQIANQQNIRIYTVTPQNASTVLPQLQVDEHVRADIVAATNAGFEVTVPQSDIAVANFTGTGYIITDPQTGAGQYLISGGRNGDSSPTASAVFPVKGIVAPPVVSFILGSLARTAGISVVSSSALGLGIAIPVGVILDLLLIAIIALLIAILFAAIAAHVLDKLYPRTSRRLRHYTADVSVPKIFASQKFFVSVGDHLSMGTGVYFADPNELVDGYEPVNPGVGCPPTPDQSLKVATVYELPEPGVTPDPTRASGYIEIEVLREGVLKERRRVINGATQILVFEPVFPDAQSPTGLSLPIGVFSQYVRFHPPGICPPVN